MSEYDDTNKGAAFTPFPTQQMILAGKINVQGKESKTILGRPIIEVYQRLAIMFENDKANNDKAPDYSGPIDENLKVAGWRRSKDGKPYMSLSVSAKGQQQASSGLPNDDIPF
jgi:uncharacterized protein (DUF736 family)